VRLILTTSSTFPRVKTLSPSTADQSTGGLSNFAFHINGKNIPCSAVPASCSTTVKFLQGANSYTASCTGAAAGTDMDCTVNISSAIVGLTQLQIISGGNTLTIPAAPAVLGGINVIP
jgi:hypothetical protein